MHDFSCTARSTPSPTAPFPCFMHLRVGRNGERLFNCGGKFTSGEGVHKFAESSKWCQSPLVMWLVILAGRGVAVWGRSTLKETEEVNLWCHCKAALQRKPITYPASWRLQGRAAWGETKETRGGWQCKDLGCLFSVQVSTNMVMSSRVGWKETALQSTRTPVHFVYLFFCLVKVPLCLWPEKCVYRLCAECPDTQASPKAAKIC